jgi:PhnB protein
MQIVPYLSFNGDCEAAFKFYEETLGGRIGAIFRYGGSPLAGNAPADWSDKIMHGNVTIGDLALMGADIMPDRYEAPKGFSLSIQIKGTPEAERIFRELSNGGTMVMPLEKTFWAARFGMVVDRFGIPWLINCEESEQRSER